MDPKVTVRLRDASVPRLVIAHLAGDPGRVALIVALAVALAASAVLPPIIVAGMIDRAIGGTIDIGAVAIAGCGVAALAAWDSLLTLVRRNLVVSSEIRLRASHALDHFRNSVQLPMSAYQESNHAALIRSFDDLDSVVDVVAGTSTEFLASAMVVLSYAGLLLAVQPQLSLVFFVLAGLALAASIVTTGRSRSAQEQWLPERDSRFACIAECLTSMATIKTLGAHEHATRAFCKWQAAEDRTMAAFRRRLAIADSVNRFWMVGMPGFVAVAGGLLLAGGQLTVGSLVLFLSVSAGFIGALTSLHSQIERYQQAVAALARMQSALRTDVEPLDERGARSMLAMTGSIKIVALRFRHGSAPADTLARIDLHIQAGEHVAVVGASGRGKTTLAGLLARLYEATGGTMLIDGVPIDRMPLDAYRQRVLLMPHGVDVFSANVRDNVALWDESIGDAQIWQALAAACLADTVRAFGQGLETILGYRGNPLSAGQKQRLALARVFVRRPEVLILDEATSNLDIETERVVLANVRAFMAGRTLIVITHRTQIAESLDRSIALGH